MRRPDQLTAEQASFLEQMQDQFPVIQPAPELLQEFFGMARQRARDHLEELGDLCQWQWD